MRYLRNMWQHVLRPSQHCIMFTSNNLCKQQLRTNCHRWGYQVGFSDYCWQRQIYLGGFGATTSWEHGQAHNCEAPTSLRRQNYSVACLRLLPYLSSFYSSACLCVFWLYALIVLPTCPRTMDYWEFSINFVDDNPHGNDKRRTSQQGTLILNLIYVSYLGLSPAFLLCWCLWWPNQNLRHCCNSLQPESIEMAEKPHSAWNLGACAKGQNQWPSTYRSRCPNGTKPPCAKPSWRDVEYKA